MNPDDIYMAQELAGIVLMALTEYAQSHPANLLNSMIYAANLGGVSIETLRARLRTLKEADLIPRNRSTVHAAVRDARRRAEAPVQKAVTDYLKG